LSDAARQLRAGPRAVRTALLGAHGLAFVRAEYAEPTRAVDLKKPMRTHARSGASERNFLHMRRTTERSVRAKLPGRASPPHARYEEEFREGLELAQMHLSMMHEAQLGKSERKDEGCMSCSACEQGERRGDYLVRRCLTARPSLLMAELFFRLHSGAISPSTSLSALARPRATPTGRRTKSCDALPAATSPLFSQTQRDDERGENRVFTRALRG